MTETNVNSPAINRNQSGNFRKREITNEMRQEDAIQTQIITSEEDEEDSRNLRSSLQIDLHSFNKKTRKSSLGDAADVKRLSTSLQLDLASPSSSIDGGVKSVPVNQILITANRHHPESVSYIVPTSNKKQQASNNISVNQNLELGQTPKSKISTSKRSNEGATPSKVSSSSLSLHDLMAQMESNPYSLSKDQVQQVLQSLPAGARQRVAQLYDKYMARNVKDDN